MRDTFLNLVYMMCKGRGYAKECERLCKGYAYFVTNGGHRDRGAAPDSI